MQASGPAAGSAVLYYWDNLRRGAHSLRHFDRYIIFLQHLPKFEARAEHWTLSNEIAPSSFYILLSTLYTLQSTLFTLHSTLYTLHSSLYTLRSTLCTLYREQFKIECYIIDPGLTPLDTPLDSSLTEIIFHSLGKLLCKIIFVYYKLHGPTVILGVLSLTVVLLQSLCSFCTNNDMKRENWTLDTAHSDQKHSQLVMVFLMLSG